MLVAAEILGNSTLTPEAQHRRLVFVALSGEPWGNQGSKRLLWELRSGGNSTAGLDLSNIDQVHKIPLDPLSKPTTFCMGLITAGDVYKCVCFFFLTFLTHASVHLVPDIAGGCGSHSMILDHGQGTCSDHTAKQRKVWDKS